MGVFIAWRKLGRRTRDLANELGFELKFIPYGPPYIRSYLETVKFIKETKPDVIIAQLPQGPLLWVLARLRGKFKFKLIADTHTGFLVYDGFKGWLLNAPFKRYLRVCDLVIVHNEDMLNLLPTEIRGKSLVLYDPMPKPIDNPKRVIDGDYIVMPASWGPDEPIEYVIKEYLRSRCGLKLVITGNYLRKKHVYERLKDNPRIVFTGYLSTHDYYSVMSFAKLVIAATTREYTMLSAAWEAISYEKPLIVSYTKTLHNILGDTPLYFNPSITNELSNILNTVEGKLQELKEGITKLKENLQKTYREQLSKLKEYLRGTADPH
mgnify:CR=1 FL=1